MSDGHIGVFGASGHARVLADCAIAAGLVVDAFYDDDAAVHGRELLGSIAIPVKGGRDMAVRSVSDGGMLIGIGENRIRSDISKWFAERGVGFARVIHPSAVVGLDVEIGDGTLVVAGAVINTGASIGEHVIVNTSAIIDHDCEIGDFVHISPGAHLAGNVKVGEGVHIGTGASIIPGATIGAWAVVGAGATVYRDVPEGVTVVGVPPRVLKNTE